MDQSATRVVRWVTPPVLSASLYFGYFMALGAYMPFISLYYERLGLTGMQIGTLAALPILVSALMVLVWGGIADTLRLHGPILRVNLLLVAGAVLLISTARSFGSLIPFVIAYAIFSSPIVPLLDSSALAVAERSNHSYGQLRLWGSVGWAASTLLVGAIIERFAIRWLFYSYVGLILVTFLIAFLQRPRAQAIRVSLRRGLKEMLTDRALALFLVTIFLISLTLGAANSFFSLYLDGLGAQEGAIGLAWAIAALSEIPVMLYSGRIMRRIGARGLLYVALVTFAGRWLLYSFIRVPALAIAVQVLHGLSFATYLVGGVTYMSEHAPAGLSTTAQSLFNLVAFGLGSIAGSLVGGYLYQTAGVTTLFRALSVIAAGGFVLFLISQRWPGNAARDRVPAMDSPEQ